MLSAGLYGDMTEVSGPLRTSLGTPHVKLGRERAWRSLVAGLIAAHLLVGC